MVFKLFLINRELILFNLTAYSASNIMTIRIIVASMIKRNHSLLAKATTVFTNFFIY